jgi:hypothetical protein
MTAWRERPRVLIASAVAMVAIVDVAMLVGVAPAGDGDCPEAGGGGPSRTQR